MDSKTQELLDQVPPQPLAQRDKFWKGFLYGEYGTSKTVTTAKCIEKRGLFIATDRGIQALYNHPELLDKVEVVEYQGLRHLTAVAESISGKTELYKDFDMVAVDTISQVQEEYLDWLNDNFQFSGDHRIKATPRNRSDRSLTEQEIIGMADYNLARRNMSTPIKSLIKAPVNVMFLAHLREPTFMEQSKGKLVRRPTLTETVYKLVAREVSFMGLVERKGDKRTIQFSTDTKTVSKSQIAELDNKTINADDLGTILAKWRNK